MKVKNGTNSDTEEEEEQMNVEKDFQDGFVKPEEIADIGLFKSCLALQKWNELPLKEGVRCPCLEKFTQMRCTNAVSIDAPVQLVNGYEERELKWSVQVCGIHRKWPERYCPEQGYGIWYEGMEVKDGSISSSDDEDTASAVGSTADDIKGTPVPNLFDFSTPVETQVPVVGWAQRRFVFSAT